MATTTDYVTSHVISTPVYHWRWYVAEGCYFYVERAPNAFHRWMQRVFLGLHWEPIP